MKKLKYIVEYILLSVLLCLFRLIGVDAASACGGWLGRTIGPRMAASRKARTNIARALPGSTPADIDRIIRGMWDNLGRVIAEYPHLERICRDRVSFTPHSILQTLRSNKKPAVIFTGHLANWEVAGLSFALQYDTPVGAVYRAPNNPYVDKMLNRTRTLNGTLSTFPKSRSGMRQIVEALKDGMTVGILIDQKYNEGVTVPFFDMPAKTSPAYVQLAQKFECPLVPVRIERLKGAHFRITTYDPVATHHDDRTPRAVEDVINETHDMMENWIKDKPEQWLWLHRRWSGSAASPLNLEDNLEDNDALESRTTPAPKT